MKKLLVFDHVDRRRKFAQNHLCVDKSGHGRRFAIDLAIDAVEVAYLVRIKVYTY